MPYAIKIKPGKNVKVHHWNPDLVAMLDERSQHLAQALSKLPYEQREVLFLYLYSGLKFRTIAKLENESISTIQGRYRYGLTKLRSILNGEAGL